jgi:hypothetical protein
MKITITEHKTLKQDKLGELITYLTKVFNQEFEVKIEPDKIILSATGKKSKLDPFRYV